jgi:hypothetical protein
VFDPVNIANVTLGSSFVSMSGTTLQGNQSGILLNQISTGGYGLVGVYASSGIECETFNGITVKNFNSSSPNAQLNGVLVEGVNTLTNSLEGIRFNSIST